MPKNSMHITVTESMDVNQPAMHIYTMIRTANHVPAGEMHDHTCGYIDC